MSSRRVGASVIKAVLFYAISLAAGLVYLEYRAPRGLSAKLLLAPLEMVVGFAFLPLIGAFAWRRHVVTAVVSLISMFLWFECCALVASH